MSNNLKSAVKALKKQSQPVQQVQTVNPINLNKKTIKSETKYFKKLKKGGWKGARVYETDFRRILTEVADKEYEEAGEESDWCDSCGVYSIDLDMACQVVMEIADKTIKALEKKSYFNHHHQK